MRAVIQRVKNASVTIDKQVKSSINTGLLVLLGIENSDESEDVIWLSKKIAQLRIFDDDEGIMNLSLIDIKGEALIVSQFTLHSKTKKGTDHHTLMQHDLKKLFLFNEKFIKELDKLISTNVKTGEFGAMMDIKLTNSGPVTIIIDTKMKE